ncbi:MAG: ferrous iron transport protein B, partial [Planctomycetes bacterium]|nr:ferrous iron transport protein B [Planctomycetota bacterium]
CRIDIDALARALGVPVIPLVGNRHRGIDELKLAIGAATIAAVPTWPLPEALWEELHVLGRLVAEHASQPVPSGAHDSIAVSPEIVSARRLLTGESGGDLARFSGSAALTGAIAASTQRLSALGIDAMQADIEARYRWIDGLVAACVRREGRVSTFSERVDSVLLHPVLGLGIFAAIMAGLFVSIFWLAGPLMGSCEAAVAWLGELATGSLADGPLKDFLLKGVFAGVGAVVVFVPQIALLFLFLALLEDSGYLARATFLMDRLLAKVGLHGKSFIPLLSSFACAIPGVMAARTIESPRERLATILVAPFMSCSARLPVYGLLIGAFFAAQGAVVQGLVLLGCYLLGIVAAVAIAWALRLVNRRHGKPAAFILELPTYKMPQPSLVGRQVWSNTRAFLTKAGTTIFCLSMLLWALAYYPRPPEQLLRDAGDRAVAAQSVADDADENAVRSEAEGRAALEYSAAGRLGHAIEPVIAPLGFDWKMGVGLIGAFAAREVFNSTLSIIYSLGEREADDIEPLQQAIVADRRADGTPVWRPLVAVSMLIWFVLAMQCISTTAVVRRETGGWTWPLAQLAVMNVLAYLACLGVYQVGSAMGY